MRAFLFFLLLLFTCLLLPENLQGQSTLTLSTAPIEISGLDSVTLQIPADLDTFVYTDITFFLEGGDGGKAERGNTTGRSGDGAQVSVRFPLGRGANALRPGGLIRFVVGSRGQNTGGGSTNGGAGGGGGTAILYKDPGVANSGGSVPTLNLSNSINYGWTLLAVAGGGGGGYVDASNRSNGRPGQSGTAGSDGRSTGGDANAGGTNGAAGVDQNNDGSGAGCGYLTTNGQGNNGYNGRAGGITGRKGDDFANRSGGFGYGPGGHGRSSRGGGGGGGFSGGGSGRNGGSAGGGGGSFASSASTATNITQRDDNNSPDDGFITYTFTEDLTPGPAPDAFCKDMITVVVNDGIGAVVTGLDLDNGSTNPLNEPLEYLVALNGLGDNFAFFTDVTFDCGDIGPKDDWFLAVANSADTTICATQTTINVEVGTTIAPICPNDRAVNLSDGCIGTVPPAFYRPVNSGDCSDPSVTLVLPNATVVNDRDNFLQGDYEFIAGTTEITYTNTVGSCSFNLTLNAGYIPSLNCRPDRSFTAPPNECGRRVSDNFTEVNNGDDTGVTWRLTNNALDFVPVTGTGNMPDQYYFPRGINTIEYFFEDAGGCVSECSFQITIEGNDVDFPVLECADEITVEYSPDLNIEDFYPQGILSLTDDCGIASITYDGISNLDCGDIGRTVGVFVEVQDIDGSFPINCSFDLTITETTPPVARCVESLTRSLDANGRRTIATENVDDGTTADCDFTLNFVEVANNGFGSVRFNCNDLGENIVTLTATNDEGNGAADSCTTIVTIVDNTPPVPDCQNITLILGEAGDAFLAPISLAGGSTDNCTITDYAASKISFNCDDLGANPVQLTLTDQSGNSSSCTSTVPIQDSPNRACDQGAFVMTWSTINPNQTLTIPTDPALTYNYEVEWGDGSPNQVISFSNPLSHEYATPGEYQVRIRGDFPRIVFANSGNSGSVLSIDQWGSIEWSDMWQAFENCTNMRLLATDAPDLSQVTRLGRMFRNCSSLESPDLSNWETGTITAMPFMFFRAYDFNGDITSWDVGNVTNFNFTFDEAVAFNQDISGWNIGENVTGSISMFAMFEQALAFDQPIGSWDMNKVSTISFMFKQTTSFNQSLANWQTGSIPQMEGTFDDAAAFDQPLGDWDISAVVNMKNMLNNTALSIDNYDATLIGWSGLGNPGGTPPSNVELGAATLDYCVGEAARTELITTYGWTITDGDRNCVLPVTLTSFTGEVIGKTNVLDWSTELEEAFSHYAVERSADATMWQELGAVAGAREGQEGSARYAFTDAAPLPDSYYRLRMVDLDGTYRYSQIVHLQNDVAAADLRIFPNPTNGNFQVILPQVEGSLNLAIYNLHGTRVRAQKLAAGTNSWRSEAQLRAGVYLLTITDEKGQRWTERFIVR